MEKKRQRLASPERQEKIVAAAMSLFARKGFNGTKTKEVAQAAGCSEAVVFRYFPSKEDLYAAIITRAAAIVYDESPLVGQIIAKDDAGLLRAIATDMISRFREKPDFLRLMYFSALEGHSLSEMFFQTEVKAKVQLLSNYIRQRIQDGAFREVDPTLTAQNFLGMVSQRLVTEVIFGLKNDYPAMTEAMVENMVTIFISGLKRA